MHERFCFWSESDWRRAVENEGLVVASASHSYANPWIVENRFRNQVELFERQGDSLSRLPYPVTNLLLIAEKTHGSGVGPAPAPSSALTGTMGRQ
jgi:hypothetical protein